MNKEIEFQSSNFSNFSIADSNNKNINDSDNHLLPLYFVSRSYMTYISSANVHVNYFHSKNITNEYYNGYKHYMTETSEIRSNFLEV